MSRRYFVPILSQKKEYQKCKALKDKLRRQYISRLNVDLKDFNKAAERLRRTFQYRGAQSIYVSLHPCLEQVRFNALMDGKFLIVPDANFVRGFYLLDPGNVRAKDRLAAVRSSSRMKKFGMKLNPSKKIHVPKIKLAVFDVLIACNNCGSVLNDGNGFMDLALSILNFLGWLDKDFAVAVTPIYKGFSDFNCEQLVMKENDWWADLIISSESVIYPPKPDTNFPPLIGEILDPKRIKRSDVLFYIFNKMLKFPIRSLS